MRFVKGRYEFIFVKKGSAEFLFIKDRENENVYCNKHISLLKNILLNIIGEHCLMKTNLLEILTIGNHMNMSYVFKERKCNINFQKIGNMNDKVLVKYKLENAQLKMHIMMLNKEIKDLRCELFKKGLECMDEVSSIESLDA